MRFEDVSHTIDILETVERVKAYILADPDIAEDKTKFVEGWGWDHTKWLLEEWPTYVRFVGNSHPLSYRSSISL